MDWRNTRKLFDELSDPFVMMPINSAASSLSQGLFDANESFQEHMGTHGVSRKFWPVPCELVHDEMGIIIGNAFVLAQVAISQAVSIFMSLRNVCSNKDRFPKQKTKIMDFESDLISSTLIKQITAIDGIANYFKHYHEWPEGWDETSSKGVQKNTIILIKGLCFSEGELTENMQRGLALLNVDDHNLSRLCKIVELWRERLATQLYKDSEIAKSVFSFEPIQSKSCLTSC